MKMSFLLVPSVLSVLFLFFAAGSAQAGWYLDSLKGAPIIEVRGETDDTTLARQAGDKYIDDNLDHLLFNNEWLIVNFCAYWCGDCNNFKPDFVKASKKKEYKSIRWATADVDGVRGNEGFRKRFELPGTPSVMLFHFGHEVLGDDEAPSILDGSKGDKSYEDLIMYLKAHYNP